MSGRRSRDAGPCSRAPRCTGRSNIGQRGYCRKHYKEWCRANPTVDAAEVLKHLHRLREANFGIRRISDLTGVGRSTIGNIFAGERQRTNRPTAEAIFALTPEAAGQARVNPIGAARRLQALCALGHTAAYLGARLDTNGTGMWRWLHLRSHFITREKHEQIDELFRELAALPRPEGFTAERIRRRAAKYGWVPPLAWDEEAIDDPDAEPVSGVWSKPRPGRVPVDFADQYVDFRDHAQLGDHEIAQRVGITYDTLLSRLSRLKIPAQRSPLVERAS